MISEAEQQQRHTVTAEAVSWLGTPYHPGARIKGAGLDCGMHLIECYAAAGICPNFDPGFFPASFASHSDDPRYLDFVRTYGREFAGPCLPGDAVLWRFGRTFSHGAIVIAWPTIIHSVMLQGCVYGDAVRDQSLNFIGRHGRDKPRERLFFRPNVWAD